MLALLAAVARKAYQARRGRLKEGIEKPNPKAATMVG